jgi:ectoine hydroxylase-related dioxygenase (phytanoyl-CoA dioxygenase family)
MDMLATFKSTNYVETFRRDGYFVFLDVISLNEVEELRRAIADIPDRDEVRRKRNVYGVRNLLQICPVVRSLAGQPCIRQIVTAVIGENAFAVRAIFFDKAPGANWSLFWHQDNVIAVDQRLDLPGYVGWSKKADVWQVQPPADVLANMIAVRVHLDDSMLINGPLRVIPGSHRVGWIENLDEWKHRVPEVACTVPCGGVVVMCPLTLHASARSETSEHRRVIHIEYAAAELPLDLDWNIRDGPSLPVAMPQ